ncbi:DNA-binding transcriptional regulator, ArsR family [Halogranum rubrum]|uniref:DNA-binding transcriptional regulator, ArsR family n=1 Tax=Halogranum rubrum TaxID=553466 RepID=A0A1I4GEH5_9EURY|nr:winged helix-turn-helix domain-containing protein [Halogranum rubrum]SFL28444.1 DNA-binding transcriptional regulator, ArsR family [Halogranum rubrum]
MVDASATDRAVEAFSLLGDDTRLAILRTLWDAEDPLSFGDLRERVGVRDSGRFNYHLKKLDERFVRKTDEGYELRFAGRRVIGALLEGTYDQADDAEPIPVDGPCLECGAALTYRYEDEIASVSCDEGHDMLKTGVPPGIFAGRDDETLPRVFERYIRRQSEWTKSGFCPNCSGPTSAQVGESELWDRTDYTVVTFTCERCGQTLHSDVAAALLDHPDLVAFAREHGVGVRETPIWELTLLHDAETTVTTDPFRAAVTFRLDGDERTLVVDEAFSVVDVT